MFSQRPKVCPLTILSIKKMQNDIPLAVWKRPPFPTSERFHVSLPLILKHYVILGTEMYSMHITYSMRRKYTHSERPLFSCVFFSQGEGGGGEIQEGKSMPECSSRLVLSLSSFQSLPHRKFPEKYTAHLFFESDEILMHLTPFPFLNSWKIRWAMHNIRSCA